RARQSSGGVVPSASGGRASGIEPFFHALWATIHHRRRAADTFRTSVSPSKRWIHSSSTCASTSAVACVPPRARGSWPQTVGQNKAPLQGEGCNAVLLA